MEHIRCIEKCLIATQVSGKFAWHFNEKKRAKVTTHAATSKRRMAWPEQERERERKREREKKKIPIVLRLGQEQTEVLRCWLKSGNSFPNKPPVKIAFTMIEYIPYD